VTGSIRVDLHCHSSLSDGDLLPAQVAHSLASAGVTCASLADHNTLAGWTSFQTALTEAGVDSIVGLEMDVRHPSGPFHLLAYGFDPEDKVLLEVLRSVRQPLRASARHWFRKVTSRNGRPELVQTPTDDGCGPTPVHRQPTATEAICLIHDAGGLAFLAHPFAGQSKLEKVERLLDGLQPAGLDGLEAFYKPYAEEVHLLLAKVADERGLLVSAGSDFHGPHHHDGASPGVDFPLEYWEKFTVALKARRKNRLRGEHERIPVEALRDPVAASTSTSRGSLLPK